MDRKVCVCMFVFHTIYLHFSQHKLKKFLFSTDYHNVLVLALFLSEEGILPLSVSSSYGTYVCLSVRPSARLCVLISHYHCTLLRVSFVVLQQLFGKMFKVEKSFWCVDIGFSDWIGKLLRFTIVLVCVCDLLFFSCNIFLFLFSTLVI